MLRKNPIKRKKSLQQYSNEKRERLGVKAKKRKPTRRKEKCPTVATLDSLFSQYIRSRGECELWKFGGIRCSTKLDCSHIKSRRFQSIRWDPDNAICACAGHHLWQHDHPDQSTLALLDIRGEEHLRNLNEKYLNGKKPTPDEKRAIAKWLREQLKECA